MVQADKTKLIRSWMSSLFLCFWLCDTGLKIDCNTQSAMIIRNIIISGPKDAVLRKAKAKISIRRIAGKSRDNKKLFRQNRLTPIVARVTNRVFVKYSMFIVFFSTFFNVKVDLKFSIGIERLQYTVIVKFITFYFRFWWWSMFIQM